MGHFLPSLRAIISYCSHCMSINELASAIHEIRQKVATLDILDPEWDKYTMKLSKLSSQLSHQLLQDPVATTNDSTVMQVLTDLNIADYHNLHQKGLQLLSDLVRPEEYAARLAEIILLMPSHTEIPNNLRVFFEEARQCYALGQFAAVQSLCRTIIEIAIDDKGIADGKWRKEDLKNKAFRRDHGFEKRINLVLGKKKDSTQIYSFYCDLCAVVHGKEISVQGGSTFALKKTIKHVQNIFRSVETKPS